jgi:glycine/D-amino acid oxidase-like deaminating enzyme
MGREKARMYYEANEAAIASYRDLARQLPCEFEGKDSFLYALSPSPKLERGMAALSDLEIDFTFEKALPLPFPTAGAIRFCDQAQFHPLEFAGAIAKDLNIRVNTIAKDFLGNTVITNRGKITASHVVIATHFPIINRHGAYFMKMYQSRSYVLGLENAPDVNGMYLDISGRGLSLRNAGNLLLLGGGDHRTGKESKGWTALEEKAGKFYPQSNIQYRWAAQDCITLDGIPYIGSYSSRTQKLHVATGFNKWGMTSSMVAAQILCDRITGRESPYGTLFDPNRSVLHPQLATNLLETTCNLLRFSKPRCPHLGCALQWNKQERSWDCPCHGSRFTEDGKLLDNPATGDLDI